MYVPLEKMGVFHSILCSTKGHYLAVPYYHENNVYVNFEYGDSAAFNVAWKRANISIKEIDRRKPWRTLLNRMRFWL